MGVTARYLASPARSSCCVAATASAGFAAHVRASARLTTAGRRRSRRRSPIRGSSTAARGRRRSRMTRAAGATYVRLYGHLAARSRPSRPARRLRRRRPDVARAIRGATLDAIVEAGRGRRADADPRHQRALRAGRTRSGRAASNAGTPKAAALGEFAHGARDPLRRQRHGAAGRARLPGLERAEPQPRPRARSSASTYRAMVNAVADVGARGRPDEPRRRRRPRSVRAPEEQEAEVELAVAPLAFMRSLLCLSKGTHPHATCSDADPLRRLVAPPVHVRRARSGTRGIPTTSRSATCRRCGRCCRRASGSIASSRRTRSSSG